MSYIFGNKKLSASDSHLIIKARYIYTDDDETYLYFPGGGPSDISEKIYMPSDESMKKILKKLIEAGNADCSSYQLKEMDIFTSLSDADLKKTIPEWTKNAIGIIKQENDLYKKNQGMDGKLRILFKYKKKCDQNNVYVNLLNRGVVDESDIVLEF